MNSATMNSLCTFILFGLLKTGFITAHWSTWSTWGHCSVTCGIGILISHRTCVSVHGAGSCDGSSTRIRHCNSRLQHCPPVDGFLTAWTYWGHCSATCEGIKKRTRECHPPEYGGAPCRGNTVETSGCGALHCPVNGGWSKWYAQSECSVSCGGGVKTRTRSCNNPSPAYGGQQCSGESTQSESCSTNPCPVNGGWSEWQNPSPCSVTCGGGVRTRTRTCDHPTPANGGHQCRGRTNISEHCNTNPCPVDGFLTAWTYWGHCSATCEGIKKRTRECHPPEYGGAPCRGNTVETSGCGALHCPVNGIWSKWHTQSECTVSCGGGVKTRTRSCNNPSPAYGGQQCSGESTQSESCSTNPCPVNGGWSEWQYSSPCSVTCGGGVRTRTRTCDHPTPANGGHQCRGRTNIREHCNTNPCPVNGVPTAWGDWSPCSVTCGSGSRVRARTCSPPQYGGHNCSDPLFEMNNCSQAPCKTPPEGVTCPTCNENLKCTWNTTCHVSETCMVRAIRGFKFTTHCIMKDDCSLIEMVANTTHGEVFCCADESCVRNKLGES